MAQDGADFALGSTPVLIMLRKKGMKRKSSRHWSQMGKLRRLDVLRSPKGLGVNLWSLQFGRKLGQNARR